MIRDEEISRLVKYAEGLNVKVKFSTDKKSNDVAYWTLDGTEICIYVKKHKSKLSIILSLIHELGHHTWFVHEKNRQHDIKFDEAISKYNENETIPKKYREKIYKEEVAAACWWEVIYKDTNMRFPIYKLNQQKEYDVWQYEVFLDTGVFPNNRQKKLKKQEMKANK